MSEKWGSGKTLKINQSVKGIKSYKLTSEIVCKMGRIVAGKRGWGMNNLIQ